MLDFNKVPKVALEFVNEDHKEATEITNRLVALIEAGAEDAAAVTTELQALLDHCREHFEREEVQMLHYNFPPYPVHKSEHERVLAQMSAEVESWNSEQNLERLRNYVTGELETWFITHIATMDTVTAQFVANQGGPYNGE